jgi:hypothetical protein
MRIPFAAIVLLGLPLTAAAQSRATAQTPAPALPPIGLPLAPIGLPLPPLGLPPATTEAPRQVNRPPARPGRGHRRQNTHGRSQASIVYVVADASWAFPLQAEMPGVIMDATPDVAAAPTGSLRLDIEGRGPVQTFVDGAFVGTLDDLGGQIDLEEGTHRIELRADRYEPLKLDAKIVACDFVCGPPDTREAAPSGGRVRPRHARHDGT